MHAMPRKRRIRPAAIPATLLAALLLAVGTLAAAPSALASSPYRRVAVTCQAGSNYLTLNGRLTQVGSGVRIDLTASVLRGPSWYPVPWTSRALTASLAGSGSSRTARGKINLHWIVTAPSGSYRASASATATFNDGRSCTAIG